ncbi:MAG: hypothetical protein M0R80_15820 [Proteobacteria bacterium]|jgi:hypothetical protein|nr:hypothetical protein [Pseudomonadota bacterium]
MRNLVTAAILAIAISTAGPTPAPAAEPDRPTVVFFSRTGDPRADAMWLAVSAHLTGIPASVRRQAIGEGADPAAAAKAELASGRAAAAIWISDTADLFYFATAPPPDAPAPEPIPEGSEGWSSRCALVGSLIVPRVEALAARQPEPAPRSEAEPPEPAPQESERGAVLSVTPRVGIAIPTSHLRPFIVIGFGIDVALPPFERSFSLALDATYTRPSREGTVRDPAVGAAEIDYEVRATELKWALDVVWRFYDSGARFAAFVGCGPILQLVVARERTSLGGGDNTIRVLAPGGEVAFVFEWRLGVGGVVLDTRYALAPLDAELLGRTNGGNATAALGYRFEL